jgi:hypothetical protein
VTPLRDESGLALIEGVIACMILALAALAGAQFFDAATRTSYRAEESQSINTRLEAELEEATSLPFAELALSSAPADTADQSDPRSRVDGTTFALEQGGGDPAQMVIDATLGAVSPDPEPFTVGDISGEIYKFVVWRDDPTCPESKCPGEQDLRRVIVAARVTEAPISFDRAYHEIHSDVVDPDVAPVDNPGPGGEGNGNHPQQFFITDTPCDNSTRQPIELAPPTSDGHFGHNTRGDCSAGMQTGGTVAGAPDLMFTSPVQLDGNYPDDQQPLYDYATDLEPATGADQDKGLFVREAGTNGCLLGTVLSVVDLPLTETTRHQKIHKWVSPPMPTDFELLLTGNATLQLWTKTVNGVAQSGRICVSLFIRRSSAGIPTDIPVLNAQSVVNTQYTDSTWPTDWTEIAVPITFASLPTFIPGDRIGLAIHVERANTGNDGLEFMYDHPSFDSRLELTTNRVLPF